MAKAEMKIQNIMKLMIKQVQNYSSLSLDINFIKKLSASPQHMEDWLTRFWWNLK